MNVITIEIHESYGMYSARAAWGMSSWHRDPITGISELFGQAIKYAQNHATLSAEQVALAEKRRAETELYAKQFNQQSKPATLEQKLWYDRVGEKLKECGLKEVGQNDQKSEETSSPAS